MKEVIILRGTTLSGKSSLIKKAQVHPSCVLSSDAIREELFGDPTYQRQNRKVFSDLHKRLETRLSNGAILTVIDATHLSIKEIKPVLEIANKYYAFTKILSVVPPSFSELKDRNNERFQKSGFVIPEHIIEKHLNKHKSCKEAILKEIKDTEFHAMFVEGSVDELLLFLNDNVPFHTPFDRLWVIGDVHGCANELHHLCANIRERDPGSVIFQVGDLIDRGPYFKEVINVAQKHNVISIIGNHEMNFLKEQIDGIPCRSYARQESHEKFEGLSDYEQDKVLEYFSNMLHYAHVKDINNQNEDLFISHSLPNILVPPEGAADLREFRKDVGSYHTFCTSSNIPANLMSDLTYIHGHMHWDYIDIEKQFEKASEMDVKRFNVDAGCVYGEELIALRGDLKAVERVKSGFTYNNGRM